MRLIGSQSSSMVAYTDILVTRVRHILRDHFVSRLSKGLGDSRTFIQTLRQTSPSRAGNSIVVALLVVAAQIFAAGREIPKPHDDFSPMASMRKHLAGPAGFSLSDFDLLINYRTATPPAPAVVLRLLQTPGTADSLVPALRHMLSPRDFNHEDVSRAGLARVVSSETLWPWIDVEAPAVRAARSSSLAGGQTGPSEDALHLAFLAASGDAAMREFASALTVAEHRFLRREAPDLFRHTTDDTLLGPLERERERLKGEAVTDSVLRLSARLPLATLAEAARDFDAVARMVAEAPAASIEALLIELRREGIPVIIGTPGDDIHHLDPLLAPLRRGIVFDPGGNDRYVLSGMARPGGWLIIIDVAGEDIYQAGASNDSTGDASAFVSLQILFDLEGDDRYEGGDFAFGSAIAGFSRVYDAAGNDSYTGRSASLGFAFHGVGIMQDRSGDDHYSSAFLSQGASSTFGFGILLDDAGNDHYEVRPEFLDDLRYNDRFLSLSQGFSTGFAPNYGGGLAVLWDRAGDDRYTADIFGQGAGYWFGWGLLMDDEGRDSLKAFQYAQGAGVHFAVGTLLDGSGDDTRVSKGVSQGCGHDGGFGLFVDAEGNDHNTAVDMSAGAGSANGLGVMIDVTGDDVHDMGNAAMTLGHGDMRRDRSSLGFFLDLGGRDTYPVLAVDATKQGQGSVGVRSTSGRAPTASNIPRSDAVWRVYDGLKRGHGFGIDRDAK